MIHVYHFSFFYFQNIVFTGSVDCAIRGWDIRNSKGPVCELKGHQYAVRRIKVRNKYYIGLYI